jgi:hypothetical protein
VSHSLYRCATVTRCDTRVDYLCDRRKEKAAVVHTPGCGVRRSIGRRENMIVASILGSDAVLYLRHCSARTLGNGAVLLRHCSVRALGNHAVLHLLHRSPVLRADVR